MEFGEALTEGDGTQLLGQFGGAVLMTGQRRIVMPRETVSDKFVTVHQRVEHIPEPPRLAETVQQNQRFAGAAPMQRDLAGVQRLRVPVVHARRASPRVLRAAI